MAYDALLDTVYQPMAYGALLDTVYQLMCPPETRGVVVLTMEPYELIPRTDTSWTSPPRCR